MAVPSTTFILFKVSFNATKRSEKVLGMANESARGFRGWIYVIAVAICLLLMFFASENLSRMKQPGFYHAPRTATLIFSTKPKSIARIATESVPLAIEPVNETLVSSVWHEYRSTSQSSITMLEPPAGARLSAPIAIVNNRDPFLDSMNLQRSPTVLAENAAQSTQTTTATNVSLVRPVDTITPLAQPSLFENRETTSNLQNWPNSPKLRTEIERTMRLATSKSNSDVQDWVSRISSVYGEITSLSLTDDAAAEHIEAMHSLSVDGLALAGTLLSSDANLASDVSRLSFSIERRYAVWSAVSKCVFKGRTQFISARKHEVDSDKLNTCLQDVQRAIRATGDAPSWNSYLMLESLTKLGAGQIAGRQEQVELVREFLARVTDPRVSEPQRQVLASTEVHMLADQVHPLSIGPVDYRKLVENIETLESDPVHRCSTSLADAMQSLRFSEHFEQAAVSQAISTHYRNANLRLAVSEEFINRMMPKSTIKDKPVRQKILGADTRGASQISTDLQVDFKPDDSAWQIALRLDGDISSSTKSSSHGATFYNASIANVTAIRDFRISTQGILVNGRPTTVESHDSLKRFKTDWDALPILGDMVRHIAYDEFLQARPIAKRIMQKTIATQTDQEFDAQLKANIASAQSQFEKRLIGPLQSLDLHPMVIDMQSTETRLIVRYRVASSDQLSAYTPRPVAPGDSQLSLQVHQSSFNNMAGQIVTGDRDWTMQELSDKISDLLQQPHSPLDADAPTDITVRFSEARPITMEFDDGRMWLTLRIAALEQPGRIQLKNFIIRTSYLPSVNGLQAELTRDGVISVDGHKLGMRDRLPLRAIFSRVFSNRSAIPMVSSELLSDPRAAGLAVSQMELRDGWLAIAVSQDKAPHDAVLKANREAMQR